MTAAMMSPGDAETMRKAFGAVAWVFYKQVATAGALTDPGGAVAIAAALLMSATLDGHICLAAEEIEERALSIGAPGFSAAALREALADHPWVGIGDGSTPLVFENDLLYLRRFRDAEARLAAAILARVAEPARDAELPALANRFRAIFPNTDIDWQGVAVAASLCSRFLLITGGPGTGKTATVARLLALLFEQIPDVRVALAAPTGKAAGRLGEAIRQSWDEMKVDQELRDRLPAVGSTLHRLLGYRPYDDSFQRNASDPLEHDVVIVDEASMVPLLLMDTLFIALRQDAQIVLLGDHDQLASVEAGSVLADLVAASGALDHPHGATLAKAYQTLSGLVMPSSIGASPLRDAVVRLDRNFRFDESAGIGLLARAIREGRADDAIEVLHGSDPTVVRRSGSVSDGKWLDDVTEPAAMVFSANDPEAALEALGRIRVLCATNVGPAGTDAVTARIEQALRKQGHDLSGTYYRGRPLLLTRNDYALRLFNGDIGVVWDELGEGDGAPVERGFIASPEGGEPARSFYVLQLPGAVTAWAMSIHKAQGSEFDTVVVVLPDSDVRVLSRELLYTAVTRAKKRVVVVGPDETTRLAIGRTARRESGLAARLLG